MKIILKKNEKILCKNLEITDKFFARALGLLRKGGFRNSDGIMLLPCCQVHSFFMPFEFDVIYLDKDLKAKQMFRNVKKNRILPFGYGVKCVLELPGNSVENAGVEIGDELEIVD